jgi:uncharacterized protein
MESAELFEAIDANDAERVEALVREDPGLLAAQDEQGVSPALHALYRGANELAQTLVEAEPAPGVHTAAAFGHVDRLRALLDGDPALVDRYAQDGFTPLQLAAFFGRREAVDLLLERGADVSLAAKNPMEVTALHAAAAAGDATIVESLLERGSDANARQEGGYTALHEAALRGNDEMVDVLLRHGAQPETRDDGGRRPADLAAEKGHGELAERLTASG